MFVNKHANMQTCKHDCQQTYKHDYLQTYKHASILHVFAHNCSFLKEN